MYVCMYIQGYHLCSVVSRFVPRELAVWHLSTIAFDRDQFVDKICRIVRHSYLQTT